MKKHGSPWQFAIVPASIAVTYGVIGNFATDLVRQITPQLLAVITSGLFFASTAILVMKVRFRSALEANLKALESHNHELTQGSGISQIYGSQDEWQATAVESMKVSSMAIIIASKGNDLVGPGSLIGHYIIDQSRTCNVEAILLHSRSKHKRSTTKPGYDREMKLAQDHILNAKENVSTADTRLTLYDRRPDYRILLTDDEVFFAVYKVNLHGKRTKTYRACKDSVLYHVAELYINEVREFVTT